MEVITKNNFTNQANRAMIQTRKLRSIVDKLEEKDMSLKGSKTEQNLKDAFAGESQANRRYLYFAARADIEG